MGLTTVQPYCAACNVLFPDLGMEPSGPHLMMVSWAHPRPHPERHHDWFSGFAQLTTDIRYTLQQPPIFP